MVASWHSSMTAELAPRREETSEEEWGLTCLTEIVEVTFERAPIGIRLKHKPEQGKPRARTNRVDPGFFAKGFEAKESLERIHPPSLKEASESSRDSEISRWDADPVVCY